MRITGLPNPLPPTTGATRVVADAPHAYPCRRCLVDAEPGEVLLLLSYDPWLLDSPYRQPGPVFVHQRDCAPWSGDGLPEQQRRRVLSVRAFDEAGLMLVGEVVDGSAAEQRLDDLLSDVDVAFVHLHNAGPGCYAARADRG